MTARAAELIRFGAEVLAWLLAAGWCVRTRALIYGWSRVPDLAAVDWDLGPAASPNIIVVVPARNEASSLEATVDTLLAQDYPWLHVVLVDDRSTDGTGALAEAMAARHPDRLSVLHLQHEPDGWLGKTFALEAGMQSSRSEYLLFTEADVLLSPSLLRRACAFAESTRADLVTLFPTLTAVGFGERLLLSFWQVLALFWVRPWTSRSRPVGFGSFSLVRRDALEELGGLLPQRLAVADALTLSRRVRSAGLRHRVAWASGLVLQRWAPGLRGLLSASSRYLFAAADFRPTLLAAAAVWMTVWFLLPVAGLFWRVTPVPSLLALACIAVVYRTAAEKDGIAPAFGWMMPVAALLTLWAMLRSALLTWFRRGVLWRGTLYPLEELRGQNNPFAFGREAAKQRDQDRKLERLRRPSVPLQWKQRLDRLLEERRLRAARSSRTRRP